MADNVAVTAGSGTTIAADDIGGVLHQRVKISQGADGSATDVSSAAPLQVTLANTGANTNKILVTPDAHAVTNAGTFAVQAAQSGTWTVQPGNTVNSTAWKVDGSAVTQPVSLASVPSHAVTNAGIFAVQDSQWYVEDAAAASNPTGPALIAVRRDTLSTSEVSADGDNIALKATNKGKLHTAAELRFGDTVADTGAGTGGSATQRVIIDSSQVDGSEYETVAASQTAQVLGATGATGDFISGLLVVPATTSPGNVLLLDNATSMTVFTGGASSVSNLVPFFIPLGMTSVSGAWKVTTGANVSVIGVGNFT